MPALFFGRKRRIGAVRLRLSAPYAINGNVPGFKGSIIKKGTEHREKVFLRELCALCGEKLMFNNAGHGRRRSYPSLPS